MRPHWVGWDHQLREGKWTKLPRTIHSGRPADITNPRDWGEFDPAIKESRVSGWAGVGIVFAGDGLFGIDLDHCRNPVSGEISDDAQAILKHFPGSFAEVSP